MKAEYLTLADGRRVRILWNMNALGDFTTITGKEMTNLTSVDVNTLRTVAWCAAKEGEEADGMSLNLSEKEFGRLIDMAGIVEFSKILTGQTAGSVQKKSEPPSRLQKIFWRTRR